MPVINLTKEVYSQKHRFFEKNSDFWKFLTKTIDSQFQNYEKFRVLKSALWRIV